MMGLRTRPRTICAEVYTKSFANELPAFGRRTAEEPALSLPKGGCPHITLRNLQQVFRQEVIDREGNTLLEFDLRLLSS